MRKYIAPLLLTCFLVSCSKVPLTGRRKLSLIPSSQMLALSQDQYRQFLNQSNVVRSGEQAALVREVGNNIKNSVMKFARENNLEEDFKDFAWEFNLVQDETINAFCMPGGKVVIFSGILPVARNADGLATIMGHEVAHAIAEHGNERMSQGLATQLGGVALGVALQQRPQVTQQLFMTAYGVGTQVGVLLPFSRLHETEADRLGTIFMAMAGYNPDEAVPFWQRMKAAAGGSAPPEFLSTHPHPDTRIRKLRTKFIPEAKKYARTH